MDKTDFRLGNLIIAKYYDENGVEQETIAEISGISEDALFGDEWAFMLTTGLETEDYHGMTPIELTREILLKCGGTFMFNEVHFINMCLEYFDDKLCYSGGEGIKLSSEIQYVHQLQNLYYALTNKELKIEL